MKFRDLTIAGAALVSLTACGQEATGQVAAVVNGEEITLQEINAEIGSQIPDGADENAVRQAALQRIVERRLLAQMAREEDLDASQEYLIRERQLRDALLVQLLGQRVERTFQVPDQQEIDDFIQENPSIFSDRMIYTVDRIVFPMPSDFEKLRVLENDHSLEEVAARLRQLGIEFRRDQTQMDSALVGQQRMERILALPDGEPFIFPENGVVIAGVITGERPAPISGADARPIAVQALRNQELRAAVQQRLKQAKLEAEIEYQSGFAPPPDKPAGGQVNTAAAS